MKAPISISAIRSISPLGLSLEEAWEKYQDSEHYITAKNFDAKEAFVAMLTSEGKKKIISLKNSDQKYKNLDDSVLFAIHASRDAVHQAGWDSTDNFGVNIGSSRGATGLFETYHKQFLKDKEAKTLTSPTTTLGNISSWVAHDLQTQGPEISHSITCSTALHALLNGVAWIQSGMADKFLVGGSEAPLTSFTIAQMRALKVYAKNNDTYPCKAFDLDKKYNTMVLGEGASIACLEYGRKENALGYIEGVGYATEILEHNTSISAEASCFQRSMKMALGEIHPNDVDVIVMHAPGTKKGDLSEFKAISAIFCNKIPFLTTNKWKLGHTFGASGMLSIEFALLMLRYQKAIDVPFVAKQQQPKQLKKILVNAVGFGGNAVSILLSK